MNQIVWLLNALLSSLRTVLRIRSCGYIYIYIYIYFYRSVYGSVSVCDIRFAGVHVYPPVYRSLCHNRWCIAVWWRWCTPLVVAGGNAGWWWPEVLAAGVRFNSYSSLFISITLFFNPRYVVCEYGLIYFLEYIYIYICRGLCTEYSYPKENLDYLNTHFCFSYNLICMLFFPSQSWCIWVFHILVSELTLL